MTTTKRDNPWQSAYEAAYGPATESATAAIERGRLAATVDARSSVYGIEVREATWGEYESAVDVARRELGFNFDTGDCND
jgi:hypothetical protein